MYVNKATKYVLFSFVSYYYVSAFSSVLRNILSCIKPKISKYVYISPCMFNEKMYSNLPARARV